MKTYEMIDYDTVMNTFKELTLTNQRKVLNYFFDHTDKEDKLFNRIELNKYLGLIYDRKSIRPLTKWEEIKKVNSNLYKYMKGL